MVGAVGLVVFLVTGTLIVSGWKGLTDQHDFSATVKLQKKSFGFRSEDVPTGQIKTETYDVRNANVNRVVELRVTWDEGTGIGQTAHTVTVALADPTGREVGRETGTGGANGVTISAELLDPPSSGRFTGRGDGSTQFNALYPEHRESIGLWRATINAQGAASSSPSITYQATFVLEYYTVTYQDVAALEGSK